MIPIKSLSCAITGVIIALGVTLMFNTSYYVTLFLAESKEYALNMGCVAVAIILMGVILDIVKSIDWSKKIKEPIENDLTPRGVKPVVLPDKPIEQNNEQRVQKLEQTKNKTYDLTIEQIINKDEKPILDDATLQQLQSL